MMSATGTGATNRGTTGQETVERQNREGFRVDVWTVLLALVVLVVLSFGLSASPSEDSETRSNGTPEDNSYMDLASYNGSTECSTCHIEAHTAWQETLHPKKMRVASASTVLGDWDVDPVLEVGEGVDVTVLLSRDGADFLVDLDGSGSHVHKVDYVLGAGVWNQRYLTTIGQSRYVLPIQWNVATGEWVGYDLSVWYDDTTGDVLSVGKDLSWDLRCAGCHVTGLQLEYDDGSGEWVASFGEMGIGCEACHGPGSLHINPPDGGERSEYIWSSVDSEICGACHNRGSSVGRLGGEAAGYPMDNSGKPYKPGDHLDDLFTSSRILHPDDETSMVHRQQYPDYVGHRHSESLSTIIQSPRGQETCLKCHSTDYRLAEDENKPSLETVQYNIECVACHSSHGSTNEHELRVAREQVCSQCHKTFDAPPGEPAHHPQTEMVAGMIPITGLSGSPWMGGEAVCEDCHMPLVATSGVEYDIASHSFYFISPAKSIANGMPNSCTVSCHGDTTPGGTLTDLEALHNIEDWREQVTALVPPAEASVEEAEAALADASGYGFTEEDIEDATEKYNESLLAKEYVVSDGTMVHNHEFSVNLLQFAVQRAGEVVEDLTPGTMTGVLEDADGRAIKGATIRTLGRTWATTDSSGAFELKIAPGTYEFEVYEDGKSTRLFTGESPGGGGTNDIGTVKFGNGDDVATPWLIIGLVALGIVLAVVFTALLLSKPKE